MEVAGGKLNMLFHEMYKEFQSLWEGKTLAYTVAVITIIISIGLIYIAMNLHNNNPDIEP
jgi:cell division protein FtsL